ncbi:MAG: hypothetical protein AAGD23_02600 [Pseudomonadota bacterium]
MIAMKPQSADAFTSRIETLLSNITALDGARLPGARRIEAIAKAEREGIAVPNRYIEAAQRLAAG